MNREPYTSCPLNRISEDRKAEVAEYSRTHSIDKTVAWLARKGLKTSATALGRWLRGWWMRLSFQEAQRLALDYRCWLAAAYPHLDEKELDRRARLMFQTRAMEAGDAKTYLAISTARHKTKMDHARFEQRERALAHDREKWLAAQKSKIEAGLDALYLEIKDNAEARQLFQK